MDANKSVLITRIKVLHLLCTSLTRVVLMRATSSFKSLVRPYSYFIIMNSTTITKHEIISHTHEIFLGVFHSSITWLPKHERECIGRRICRSIQNWSFRHLQTSKTPASTHPHFLDSFVGLVACTHTHI